MKKNLTLCSILFSLLICAQAFSATQIVDLNLGYKKVDFAGKTVTALALNNQIPAPTLHFKEGDHVIINVHNHLNRGTSIHWHGLIIPWFMDGVEHVTQVPIPPGGTFRYEFTLKQSGTYWYHAHSGFQEQEGVYGALIIDPAKPSPYSYTKDYPIVLSDWSNTQPEQIFANLKKDGDYYAARLPIQPSLMRFLRDYKKGTPEEKEKLLSDYKMMQHMRMSIYDFSDIAYDAFLLNGKPNARPWTGLVKVGDVVRLRFIGAGASTIYQVKIPGTTMRMVHIQGHDVAPYDVETFTIAPGETYDVLVKINHASPYIIYAESSDTLGAAYGALVTNVNQKVDYASVAPFPIPEPVSMGHDMHGMSGMSHDMSTMKSTNKMQNMHGMNHDMSSHGNMKMSEEKSQDPTETSGTKYQTLKAAYKTNDPNLPVTIINMELSGYMGRYMWFINGIPEYQAAPILIEHGKRYRIIFRNTSMMHHPMHLHGHWLILRNGHGAYDPLMHTLDVAPGAIVVTDFDADTYGQWFFHCHHLFHMMTGMARTFRYTSFGEDEMNLIAKQITTDEHEKGGQEKPLPYGLPERDIEKEKQMLAHPVGHPPGIYLGNFLSFSFAPFQNNQRLTFKSMLGSDYHKLQIYTREAEADEGVLENLDVDIFYWRLLSEFWALKGGANYVYRPAVTPYWQPGVGIEGIMPYFIETDLRTYFHNGSVKLDLELERETQITNNLFFNTGVRGIFATQTVHRDEVGSGLNTLELMAGPAYRLTPALSVYLEYEYAQNFGAFKTMKQNDGEETAENTLSLGFMVIF